MNLAVDTTDLLRQAAVLGNARQRIREEWAKTLYAGGAKVIDQVVRKYRSAAKTTRTATARRTGALAALYAHKVVTQTGAIDLTMGTLKPASGKALRYAAVHEKDGDTVIRGKPWLAIPLAAAKTPAGVPRGEARSFHDTFIRRSKAGNPIIWQQTGKADPVPLFVLKRQVRVPGRPALKPSLADVLPWITNGLQADVSAVLTGR